MKKNNKDEKKVEKKENKKYNKRVYKVLLVVIAVVIELIAIVSTFKYYNNFKKYTEIDATVSYVNPCFEEKDGKENACLEVGYNYNVNGTDYEVYFRSTNNKERDSFAKYNVSELKKLYYNVKDPTDVVYYNMTFNTAILTILLFSAFIGFLFYILYFEKYLVLFDLIVVAIFITSLYHLTVNTNIVLKYGNTEGTVLRKFDYYEGVSNASEEHYYSRKTGVIVEYKVGKTNYYANKYDVSKDIKENSKLTVYYDRRNPNINRFIDIENVILYIVGFTITCIVLICEVFSINKKKKN